MRKINIERTRKALESSSPAAPASSPKAPEAETPTADEQLKSTPQEELEDELIADDVENDLTRASDEFNAEDDDKQDVAATAETLSSYHSDLSDEVESGEITVESLKLYTRAINDHLRHLGMEQLPVMALESADVDVQAQAKMALEGLGQVLKNIADAYVLSVKQEYDFLAELITSSAGQNNRYLARLGEVKKEFEEKKSEMGDGEHQTYIATGWYHFSDAGGAIDSAKLLPAIAKDLVLSDYILTKYPKDVAELYRKVVGLLKGKKIRNTKEAEALIKSLESGKHPAELFQRSFLGGKGFLSVTGIELAEGKPRKVVGGHQKLAELAQSKKIVETGSLKHGAKKVASYWAGAQFDDQTKLQFKFKTADIAKVIEAGIRYTQFVSEYIKQSDAFKQEIKSSNDVFTKLFDSWQESLEGSEAKDLSTDEVLLAMGQVEQYVSNIEACFKSPAAAEVARALKGARYCGYLANRMVANATK